MAKTTAPNPSLVAKSGVTYTIYTLPRCFKENALLHPFLASKTPKEIQLNNRNYTLYQVSDNAKKYIIYFTIMYFFKLMILWMLTNKAIFNGL